MKILIIGGRGMLGRALVEVLEKEHSLLIPAHKDLDITDEFEVYEQVGELKPDFVINTAAFTDVDGCEDYLEEAFKVNSLGPYYLALACKKTSSFLIHFSTEMLFDGLKQTPYDENDVPNPCLIYGLTKYQGEQKIKRVAPPKYVIFRTSWLFGGNGPKFVTKFIERALNSSQIKVVYDQIGSPTYIYDIAKAIAMFLKAPQVGLFHMANTGEASRLEMAEFIKQELSLDCRLIPISYKELGIKTYRPPRAVLTSLYRDKYSFLQLRSWQEALKDYLLNHKR